MDEFIIVKSPDDVIGYLVDNWCLGTMITCKECRDDMTLLPARTITMDEFGGGLSCEICGRELE